jgi:regulator of protease activity HflC (stomatin/prohibitin superfamily)
MEGESRQARRQAGAALAAFSPTGPVRSRLLAPLAGLLGGLVVLALTLFVTGTYFVSPGEAVIVDPLGARLARLAGALGLASQGAQPPPEVVRTEGFHLGWPLPLVDRHAVTLQEQRLRLRATFRQTGPDLYDVLEVQMRFRISDPNRWAQIDRDGSGTDALGVRLSGLLQTVLQQQRQEARRFVAAQNPALANDPNQVGAQADALVEQRLPDTVRDFVGALSDSSAARDAGVQISKDAQSGLVRGVSGAEAGAPSSG